MEQRVEWLKVLPSFISLRNQVRTWTFVARLRRELEVSMQVYREALRGTHHDSQRSSFILNCLRMVRNERKICQLRGDALNNS